jgi:hypothetical protein
LDIQTKGSVLAIGDYDGDAKPDIAATDGNRLVSVIKNIAKPGILSQSSFTVSVEFQLNSLSSGMGVAFGDFNNDRKPDLAVANSYANSLDVLENRILPPLPVQMAIPKITGLAPDSSPVGDTIVIQGLNFSSLPDSNVVVFGATRAAIVSTSTSALSVKVPPGANSQALSVESNGLITLSQSRFNVIFPTSGAICATSFANTNFSSPLPGYIAIADLDDDGRSDLVVSHYYESKISVYKNISETGIIAPGSFASRVVFQVGDIPTQLATGDLDGDFKPDIVVGTANGVSILKNICQEGIISINSFAPMVYFMGGGGASSAVVIEDMDSDGKPEIIVSGNTTISILKNTARRGYISNGSFNERMDFTSGIQLNPGGGTISNVVAVADLDVDGKPDLAVTSYQNHTVSVFRNVSTPGEIRQESFEERVDFPTANYPASLSIADLDKDGRPDLIVSTDKSISILKNSATPGSIQPSSFSTSEILPTGFFSYYGNICVGDIDGDGKPDLAIPRTDGKSKIAIFKNNTSIGNIKPELFLKTELDNTNVDILESLSIGDLDNDGRADLIATSFGSNLFSVLKNEILPPATILGVSPLSGIVGSSIKIKGRNFGKRIQNNVVRFNGILATVTACTDTTVTATVPVGATSGKVSVVVNCAELTDTFDFTVELSAQTITFNALANRAYGTIFNLTATSSSGLPVSYSSSNTSVATVTGRTVTVVGVGSTTITAVQSGNTNYSAATPVQRTLTTIKSGQTIFFESLPSVTFGDADLNLVATSTSDLPISYISNNTDVATISGNVLTIVGAGNATITAYQGGNENYNGATPVGQTLTVLKSRQSILFHNIPATKFGDPDIALSAVATSGLPISYTVSDDNIATVVDNVLTIVGAGTLNITATQNGNDHYNAATSVQRILTISKGDQTISFDNIPSGVFGGPDSPLSATSSSGLPVQYHSSNTSVAIVNENQLQIVGAGTTIITAAQEGNDNFNPSEPVQNSFVVDKADQVLLFEDLPNIPFNTGQILLAATASSGLAITYKNSNNEVATIHNNVVTILRPGSTVITASQAGNENYKEADPMYQTLLVSKAEQVIIFNPLPTLTIEDGPVFLHATSSSGLPVTFLSSNPLVAIIHENKLQVVGGGESIISATQNGNEFFEAASVVQHSVFIDVPTAIEERESKAIEIFPNPAAKTLMIYTDLHHTNQPVYLRVHDVNGKVVSDQQVFVNNQRSEIDIESLPPGVYSLLIMTDNQRVWKRFIKI